jgi:lysophospholipase L1-like esterase
MSIDLYPEYDAQTRLGCSLPNLGAASLLYRNAELWPDLADHDLVTRFPGIAFDNLTSDGAMITTVVEDQLPAAPPDATIATLTIGGNDLLAALALASLGMDELVREVARVQQRYADLVTKLRAALPEALLVIATIYDPTDGTGLLWPSAERLPIELLKQLNDRIRVIARATPRTVLADVHLQFLGHGIHGTDSWYWPPNPIEPSARGASELRRVLWNAITAAG